MFQIIAASVETSQLFGSDSGFHRSLGGATPTLEGSTNVSVDHTTRSSIDSLLFSLVIFLFSNGRRYRISSPLRAIVCGRCLERFLSLTPHFRFYDQGYKDGFGHGQIHGLIEGRALGREKGYEMFEEIGFYEGFALTWKKIYESTGRSEEFVPSCVLIVAES